MVSRWDGEQSFLSVAMGTQALGIHSPITSGRTYLLSLSSFLSGYGCAGWVICPMGTLPLLACFSSPNLSDHNFYSSGNCRRAL